MARNCEDSQQLLKEPLLQNGIQKEPQIYKNKQAYHKEKVSKWISFWPQPISLCHSYGSVKTCNFRPNTSDCFMKRQNAPTLCCNTNKHVTRTQLHHIPNTIYRIYEHKYSWAHNTEKVAEGWRELYEELLNFSSSLNMIRFIKPGRIGWTIHEARMRNRRICYKI